MVKRLDDAELAARVRAANRERAGRRREKQTTAGRVQTVVWLPVELRKQVDALTDGRTLSETVAELLAVGLKHTTMPRPSTR